MRRLFRSFDARFWKLQRCVRFFYFSKLLGSLGRGTTFYGRVTIYFPEKIKIGSGCTLNEGVLLNGRGGLTIGDNVRISSYTIIETGFLDYKSGAQRKGHQNKEIIIEDNVWIASGARILAGVRIGEGSIVAAGAVVTKDIPAKSIAKGIPATITALDA